MPRSACSTWPFTIFVSTLEHNGKTKRPKSYSTKPKHADRAAGATGTAGAFIAKLVDSSSSLDIVLIVCRACQVEGNGLYIVPTIITLSDCLVALS